MDNALGRSGGIAISIYIGRNGVQASVKKLDKSIILRTRNNHDLYREKNQSWKNNRG